MTKTNIRQEQIQNHTITGADLYASIGVYDETATYVIGAYVMWQSSRYRCKVAVTEPHAEGDLSGAPHLDTTHWEEAGFGGIDAEQHKLLNQLVHNIARNNYLEITKTSNKVSSVIIWTDTGKTIKIREVNITRDVNGKVSVIVTKQYDGAGALTETYTQTLNRTSGKVTSVNGVLS